MLAELFTVCCSHTKKMEYTPCGPAYFPIVLEYGGNRSGGTMGSCTWSEQVDESSPWVSHGVRIRVPNPGDRELKKYLGKSIQNLQSIVRRLPPQLTIHYDDDIAELSGQSYSLALLVSLLPHPERTLFSGVGFHETLFDATVEPADKLKIKANYAKKIGWTIVFAESPQITNSYTALSAIHSIPFDGSPVEVENLCQLMFIMPFLRR